MIRLATTFLFVLLFAFNVTAAANVTPSARIKETVDQVMTVLKDQSLGKQDRRDQVKEIVRKRFDYESMSQVILAASWRTASKPQREQFITLFRELLEQTYFSAVDSYSDQTVRMGRERTKGKLANVQTFIVAANKELAVSYKMRFRNDDWYAYDVTVDGVSLVSNYRTSFRNLVKSKGMEGLLAELAQKVASLKAKNKNSEQAQPKAAE
ncbi:MAG: ABC transporter substrate-binding protein [Candidatus Thiodiazotropha sp.]